MLKISRLNRKILLTILAIWLPMVAGDIWFATKETRRVAMDEIERWSVVAGETVRISLNNLMREGMMESRFAMFENMADEIDQLESVRVIRAPLVNEIFLRVREEKDIPREQEAIKTATAEIEELTRELATTEDEFDRSDLEEEIATRKDLISEAEKKIAGLRHIQTNESQQPKDDVEKQALASGEPVFLVEGDRMRVISPYTARKSGCSESSLPRLCQGRRHPGCAEHGILHRRGQPANPAKRDNAGLGKDRNRPGDHRLRVHRHQPAHHQKHRSHPRRPGEGGSW